MTKIGDQKLVISTDGLVSVQLHLELNMAVRAPKWYKALFNSELQHTLRTQPLMIRSAQQQPEKGLWQQQQQPEVWIYPPTDAKDEEHDEASSSWPLIVETVDVKLTKEIEITVQFRIGQSALLLEEGKEDATSPHPRHALLPTITAFVTRLAIGIAGRRMRREQKLTMIEIPHQDPDVILLNVLLPPAEPHECIGAVAKSIGIKQVYLPDTLDCIAGLQQVAHSHLGHSPQEVSSLLSAVRANLQWFLPTVQASLLLLPYEKADMVLRLPFITFPTVHAEEDVPESPSTVLVRRRFSTPQ